MAPGGREGEAEGGGGKYAQVNRNADSFARSLHDPQKLRHRQKKPPQCSSYDHDIYYANSDNDNAHSTVIGT